MIYYKVIRKPPLSSVRVADSIVVVLEKIRKKKCRVQSPTYTHKRKKKAQTAIIQNCSISTRCTSCKNTFCVHKHKMSKA